MAGCPAGGVEGDAGAGRHRGGAGRCGGRHGVPGPAGAAVVPHHPGGGALPGAGCGRRQHLHLRAGVFYMQILGLFNHRK